MHSPRERRSPQIMAEDGHAGLVKSGTGMEEEKNGRIILDLEGQKITLFHFIWADNYWVMFHSRAHLEQMLKDFIREAGKIGFRTGARKFCGGQVLMTSRRRRTFLLIR